MNRYIIFGYSPDQDVEPAFCKAVALAVLFGKNISFLQNVIQSSATDMIVDLPFTLNNIDTAAPDGTFWKLLSGNTAFQGVNEYSEKPYPTKGLFCVAIDDGAVNIDKDLDNFQSWSVNFNVTSLTVKYGIVNSSQTDFYTPLDGATSVVYQKPKGYSYIDNFGGAGQGSGVPTEAITVVSPHGSGSRPNQFQMLAP